MTRCLNQGSPAYAVCQHVRQQTLDKWSRLELKPPLPECRRRAIGVRGEIWIIIGTHGGVAVRPLVFMLFLPYLARMGIPVEEIGRAVLWASRDRGHSGGHAESEGVAGTRPSQPTPSRHGRTTPTPLFLGPCVP